MYNTTQKKIPVCDIWCGKYQTRK